MYPEEKAFHSSVDYGRRKHPVGHIYKSHVDISVIATRAQLLHPAVHQPVSLPDAAAHRHSVDSMAEPLLRHRDNKLIGCVTIPAAAGSTPYSPQGVT